MVKQEKPTEKQIYFRDRAYHRGRVRQLDFNNEHSQDDDDEPEEEQEVFQPEPELESEDAGGEALNQRQPEIHEAEVTQGKRRRSENQRNSLPSASPAKRQRTDRQSGISSGQNADSQSQTNVDKGKRRARSQSDDENDVPVLERKR
jgi:hypothetical protein